MRIADILRRKGTEVHTVHPSTSVADLLAMLARRNVGALVVVEGQTVCGIVSERDVVRRMHADESSLEAPVSAIMSEQVRTCERDDTVNDLMHVMTEGRFRHVPVVQGGRLSGIVSIGDVVKARMSELEFERDQLDSYVHGSQS